MSNALRNVPVVLLACLASLGSAHARMLSFEGRVAVQEAIERARYAHQEGASKPFSEAVPRALLERKVRTYLAESAAVEALWHTQITAEMLDREVERMATHSRMPERLRELFSALHDDPFLVRECLGRQILADRLVRNFFAFDERIHAAARLEAETLRDRLAEGSVDPRAERPDRVVRTWVRAREGAEESGASNDETAPLSVAADAFDDVAALGEGGAELEAGREAFLIRVLLEREDNRARVATYTIPKRTWDDWWKETEPGLAARPTRAVASATGSLPALPAQAQTVSCTPRWDNRSLDDVPEARAGHTAVWTGSTMIVWGGGSGQLSGSRYDPATDTWSGMALDGAPFSREGHTAVWTGSRMIVWGGGFGTTSNTGGVYDPVGDAWTPTSTGGAPSARGRHAAVWTGTRMIVWGGSPNWFMDIGGLNDGAQYDPDTDTWSSISSAGAPAGRFDHTAVWTGSAMVIWGGWRRTGLAGDTLDTGGRYDPVSDTWTTTSTTNVPSARRYHTAVWTGTHMLVWGGTNFSSSGTLTNTGGSYDPVTDTWSAMSITDAPSARSTHTAVWTGSEMVVWGGSSTNRGGRYDPATDHWTATSLAGAPTARSGHTAIWTGLRMVVWGGSDLDTGGRYDPTTDSWTPTARGSAPSARTAHAAVWTGNTMIVWGGLDGGSIGTGGRYDPATDQWTPTSQALAPAPRHLHRMVWTGSRMLVWGGRSNIVDIATGGQYDPIADAWTAISTTGAPTPRYNAATVWTGSSMVVWSGETTNSGNQVGNTGGRYDPVHDTWTPTTTLGAPAGGNASFVWTGKTLVVLNGPGNSGRYDPVTDAWAPVSTTNAPAEGGESVWTGSVVLVWNGSGDARRYDPLSDRWFSMSTTNQPSTPRIGFSFTWTGGTAVVWGGRTTSPGNPLILATGGIYDPLADAWSPTPLDEIPSPRQDHTAVWTGRSIIVWGGDIQTQSLRSGGIYLPGDATDDDGDGFTECTGDCDDANPALHVGAAETCNGLDDNCNGLVDEVGFVTDTDGDAVHDACDDCPHNANSNQLDTDGDHVGNACDNCVLVANSDQANPDGDGPGSACDNCPGISNPAQADADADHAGDVCDDCPADFDPNQSDTDHDGEGDVCDLNDGSIWELREDKTSVSWQAEVGPTSWNVYFGDLGVLKSTGTYTQLPGSNPLADRDCGQTSTFAADATAPASGQVSFSLVTGVTGGVEGGLGTSSTGPRANAHPCP